MQQAQDLLEKVDSAIENILVGGQAYKIGSRQLTRADLKELKTMKNDLTAQIANNQDTGLLADTYVAFFDGR